MNWFKKTFGKRNWETIWVEKAPGVRTLLGVITNDITIAFVIQVEKQRNKYRSYMTDGDEKKNIDINYVIAKYPEVKEILIKNNIKF